MASNPRLEDLRRRLEREPGSRLFAQYGEELRRAGELEEAVRVCRDGLAQQPGYSSARMTLGRALLDLGDLEGAADELGQVVAAAPDNIAARRYLGECQERRGDVATAMGLYRETLLRAPGDEWARARLAALEKIGEQGTAPAERASAAGDAAGQAVGAAEGGAAAAGTDDLGSGDVEFELETPRRSGAPELTFRPLVEESAEGGRFVTAPAPPPPVAPSGVASPSPPSSAPSSAPALVGPEADTPAASRAIPPAGPAMAAVAPGASGATRHAAAEESAHGAGGELASATLAELYFAQGALDRAEEMYAELAQREPQNAQLKERLAGVRNLLAARPGPGDPSRSARVRRVIERLERMRVAAERAARGRVSGA